MSRRTKEAVGTTNEISSNTTIKPAAKPKKKRQRRKPYAYVRHLCRPGIDVANNVGRLQIDDDGNVIESSEDDEEEVSKKSNAGGVVSSL